MQRDTRCIYIAPKPISPISTTNTMLLFRFHFCSHILRRFQHWSSPLAAEF